MKSLVFKITREKLEVKKVAILFLCDIFNFSDVRSGCLLHKTNLGVIQKVLSLRREGGGEVNEKRSKTNKGGSQHVCTFALFKKKNAVIFNMKFYSYSPVFPIDYNSSIKH